LPKDLPKSAAVRTTPKSETWCGVPSAKTPLMANNEVTAPVKLQ
jgi:hypothetical protein